MPRPGHQLKKGFTETKRVTGQFGNLPFIKVSARSRNQRSTAQ
jgi:hypothetical protein